MALTRKQFEREIFIDLEKFKSENPGIWAPTVDEVIRDYLGLRHPTINKDHSPIIWSEWPYSG